MKMLALDLGKVRTGVAVCDQLEMLACPVCVVNQRNLDKLIDEVLALAKAQGIEKIIVGHPKNMDGTVGESAKRAEQVAQMIEQRAGLKTVLWDERSTTVLAQRLLHDGGIFGKKRREVVDAMAAVLILESYMSLKKSTERKQQNDL